LREKSAQHINRKVSRKVRKGSRKVREEKTAENHSSPSSSVTSASSAVKNSPPRFALSVKKPQCTSWLKTPTQNSQRKKKLVICREPFFTIQLRGLSALCG
jgi:hypothetical protein